MADRNPWIEVLRRAGWAPIAVLVLHRVVVWAGVREQADHWVHGSGGAAAAYFALHWCRVFGPRLGATIAWTHYMAAFCVACTAGLFVELVEFASDEFFGTNIQHDVRETMLDLVCDVLGAVLALLTILVWRRLRGRSLDEQRHEPP